MRAVRFLCAALSLWLVSMACSSDGTSSSGSDGARDASSTSDSSTSNDSASGADTDGADRSCREYNAGESGGLDFSTLIDQSVVDDLDLTIDWGGRAIAALDASAFYFDHLGRVRVTMTGIVEVNDTETSTPLQFRDVPLTDLHAENFALELDGTDVTPDRVICTGTQSEGITVVFALDVTGSMMPVIEAVRDSLLDFVDTATALGVRGNVGVVTFQDTVGVNISFEDCSGVSGVIPERSPFFAPIALDDAEAVAELRAFIASLHADNGQDLPENLAGAIDFALNNTIGTTTAGDPNIIGDGVEDPPFTEAWPTELLEGFVIVVAITDSVFHPRDHPDNSLEPAWAPRDLDEILTSIDAAMVGVIDPALVDFTTDRYTEYPVVDADMWAELTGGFGIDHYPISYQGFPEDVSFFDLELVLLSGGLLEIPLAPVLASTCIIEVDAEVAPTMVAIELTYQEKQTRYELNPRVITLQ